MSCLLWSGRECLPLPCSALLFFPAPLRRLQRKEGLLDVTEVYKQLPEEKKQRRVRHSLL